LRTTHSGRREVRCPTGRDQERKGWTSVCHVVFWTRGRRGGIVHTGGKKRGSLEGKRATLNRQGPEALAFTFATSKHQPDKNSEKQNREEKTDAPLRLNQPKKKTALSHLRYGFPEPELGGKNEILVDRWQKNGRKIKHPRGRGHKMKPLLKGERGPI